MSPKGRRPYMALVAFLGSEKGRPDIASPSVVMALPARNLIFRGMFIVVEVPPFLSIPVVGVVCGNDVFKMGRSSDAEGLSARRFDNLI